MAITLVVEDGTGVVGANAYDDAATAETWLTDEGYTAFAATSANQVRLLTSATRAIEQQIVHSVTGWPLREDQGLLYPRSATEDARGRTLESDERPLGLRHGIFLLAELMAAAEAKGSRLQFSDPRGYLSGVGSGSSRADFRRERNFSDLYPDAWRMVSESLPVGGLRLARA